MLVVATVLATGCIGPTRTRGRVIGGVTAALGTLVLVDGLVNDCTVDEFNEIGKCIGHDAAPYLGATMMAIGAIVLLVNELHGSDAVESPDDSATAVAPPPPVDLPEPETTDPTLRQLTLQASFASRRGHCQAVRTIADRIDSIDAAYRRVGFLHDQAIAACL